MRSSYLLALTLLFVSIISVANAQSAGGKGGQGNRDARIAAIKAALQTCEGDRAKLCPNTAASDIRGVLRCLALNVRTLSVTCKTAIMAVARGNNRPGSPGSAPSPATPAAGTPGQVSLTQLKQCMPGIIKTCQPQVVELMTSPLDTDGATLVACAKAHSSTIGGPCEKIVEKLTQDGLAEDLIACGQDFLGLCPSEAMALMASEMTDKVNWRKVVPLLACLKKQQSQIPGTCGVIEDALSNLKPKSYAKEDTDDDEDSGYGNPALAERGNQRQRGDEGHHGGGAGAVVASMLGICVCFAFAGVAYWKRDQISGAISGRQQEMQFHNLDLEHNGGAAIARTAPPQYAVVHSTPVIDESKIVTATPIA